MKSTFLKSIFILLPLINLGFNSIAQTSICLGTDVTVCVGAPVQINDCAGLGSGPMVSVDPYTQQVIPFAPNPFAGTAVNLSDDSQTGALPIGFNFCFFGTTYSQFYIGSNGWIAFSPQSTSFNSAMIPSVAGNVPKNCIMGAWQDWHPGVGSNVGNYIRYQTLGTAPNRRLVVSFNQIPFFSCTAILGTFQMVIYETTNNIETHITNKPACLAWAGGTATHGVHNAAGTVAFVVPGRNSSQWTVTNEGRRFSPTIQYNWQNTLGQTFPFNNGVLNIPSAASGTVGYFLTTNAQSCVTANGAAVDTSWVTGVSVAATASSTPDICTSGIGTVTANPTGGFGPFTYNWPGLGATTQTVNGVFAGTYTVQVTNSIGCVVSTNVLVTDTPAAYTTAFTIVSCPGGSDGTATATMIPALGTITYLWNDPAAQTTQTATGLSAGTYSCTISSTVGCQNTLSVTITEIPGMIANFSASSNVTCNSGNDGVSTINVTAGTAFYSYSWDNSTSTSNIADDLFAGANTVTITDGLGCVITATETLTEPPALTITTLTPDTQICPEDDILLVVTGSGGSSPYTFTWDQGGSILGTGTSITVDPTNTNTVYTVTLSEDCGSPIDQRSVTITFPTPIRPLLTPNQLEDCVVGEFEFINSSINGSEIATTYIDFGNLNSTIEIGNDSTSQRYNQVGTYTIYMSTTSIYGCVYDTTFTNLLRVVPVPDARFFFSNNPASVYETTIKAYDKSIGTIVDWQWFAPGSIPATSSVQNPTLVYPEDIEAQYPVTLIVTSIHGCTDTITELVTIQDDLLFYAPNTFTPDGNEHNQTWKLFIKGADENNFEVSIFNRWGEHIWESNNMNVGWDGTYNGKIVPTGTYSWKATVKNVNDDGKKVFTGHINLIK